MFPLTMAPKWPILVSQCGMDHQKPTVLLIFGTFSLGGCGGHPMRPKLNLKDKDQMSTPNEYTDNFKSNLTCIFPSVRAKLKKPLCPRTLCKCDVRTRNLKRTMKTIKQHLTCRNESGNMTLIFKIYKM